MPATRRVLVVEDQPAIAEIVRILLVERGHVVHVATDGERALDAVGAFAPDVMLVDLTLPGIDGLEVARRVRAKLGPGLRLVALTAHERPDVQGACLAAGFDHYALKPLDLAGLERVLDDVALA